MHHLCDLYIKVVGFDQIFQTPSIEISDKEKVQQQLWIGTFFAPERQAAWSSVALPIPGPWEVLIHFD